MACISQIPFCCYTYTFWYLHYNILFIFCSEVVEEINTKSKEELEYGTTAAKAFGWVFLVGWGI